MNIYISIMNEVVEYIENRINDKLTLSYLADHFGISDFHFNRMFHTVTGSTLKQYILGRKLTRAMQLLTQTDQPIIDIAYELNFEYPEVFSRAFKKQYGLSPSGYRENPGKLDGTPRACIIERNIINYGGTLAIKGDFLYLSEFSLTGIPIEVNENQEDFQSKLERGSLEFVQKSMKLTAMQQDYYYTVVNCNGEDNGDFTVFCGRKPIGEIAEPDYKKRVIPEGWYISFRYKGVMFDILETFIDELFRWIIMKEVELNPIGIGMIDIFPRDYEETHEIEILVPVRKPV